MTEIREVLGERTALTSDDLDKLVYTEQVNFHTMMHLAFKNSHSSDNQGSPEDVRCHWLYDPEQGVTSGRCYFKWILHPSRYNHDSKPNKSHPLLKCSTHKDCHCQKCVQSEQRIFFAQLGNSIQVHDG